MILPQDAVLLAYTKYKTRRFRTILTVVSSSLFFGIIVFAILTSQGLIHSLTPYFNTGYGGRYYVEGRPIDDPKNFTFSNIGGPNDVDPYAKQAAANYAARYPALLAEARKYGYPEPAKPENNFAFDIDRTKAQYSSINIVDPKESFKTWTGGQLNYLSLVDLYGSAKTSVFWQGKPLKDQEDPGQSPGTSVSLADDKLVEPIVYKGQSFSERSGTEIPAIIPMSMAIQISETRLTSKMKAKERYDLISKVRSDFVGKSIEICVENPEAGELRNTAEQIIKDIANNKNNADYIKPELIYADKGDSCNLPKVASDKRTDFIKASEDFQRRVEGKELPSIERYQLKIVGFSPGAFDGTQTGFSLASIFYGQGSFFDRIILPSDFLAKSPNFQRAKLLLPPNIASTIVELPTRETQKAFIDQFNCDFSGFSTSGDPYKDCRSANKLFVQNFGNNASTLADFQTGFEKAIKIASIIFITLSMISVWATLSKIISDSRREIGVFRALGAKRFDIAQIYYTYSALVGAVSFVGSLAIGTIGAIYINSRYSERFTFEARDTFGVYEKSNPVNFIYYHPRMLGFVLLCVISAALLGATLPILMSIRRHPIKAMREE